MLLNAGVFPIKFFTVVEAVMNISEWK